MTEKRSPVRSRWSELPTELLELIMRKLGSVVDILRFKAVCSGWYKGARSYISAPYFTFDIPQTPWLMIPGGEDNPNVHTGRFFNLAEFKYYTIKNLFGDFPYAWCVGSSHGWLVLVEEKATARLFNPFSRDRIELPSLKTLLSHNMIRYDHIKRVVTSSKPPPSSSSSSKDFSVVIIYSWSRPSRLAFYRHGDKTWTPFGCIYESFDDGVFNSTNGYFFALATTGSVHVWDLRQCVLIKRLYPGQNQVYTGYSLSSNDFILVKDYLVESLGELLRVRRFIATTMCNDNVNHHVICPYRTCNFHIYRLKSLSIGFEWEKVESLHNRALFLGRSHSMSLSSHNFPECEENSIYFTDAYDYWWRGRKKILVFGEDGVGYGGHDVGVYKVKDNIVKPLSYHMRIDCWSMSPPPFWIVPDIILDKQITQQ